MSGTIPSNRRRLARREIPVLPSAGRGLRNIPAWSVSLILHLTAITLVGAFWVSKPAGTQEQPERPVGIAFVHNTASGEQYYLGESGKFDGGAASDASAEDDLPDSMSSSSQSPLLSDLLPGSTAAAGGLNAATGALGLGEGGASIANSRDLPTAKTRVFGIEGEGSRFLYVFDRSDSMNGYGGLPLRTAKNELLKSLESLGAVHEFQIIFYNDAPLPFGGMRQGGPQLFRGDEHSKRKAQIFVRNITAIGGTRHTEAIRMALSMGPDVVFFLTDADQPAPSARDLDDIVEIAASLGASIHAIQFGAGPNQGSGAWIQSLAERSTGKYRYIDVSKL